jgi:hypothetical protein
MYYIYSYDINKYLKVSLMKNTFYYKWEWVYDKDKATKFSSLSEAEKHLKIAKSNILVHNAEVISAVFKNIL